MGSASASPSASASASASASGSPEASGKGTAAVAAKGGTLGGAGSACPLPVTFDVAADWKPKKVEPIEDPDFQELNELLKRGTVTMACEIDAKPAGNIGFLRVWTDARTDTTARKVLEAFVGAEGSASSVTYREIEAGAGAGASAVPATEATYMVTSKLLDEQKKARALAVMTPRGPVVLELGGMDSEEHEQMLPAYELAKSTLAAAPAAAG
ncbi:lipoprotein [Streptomyces sp. TRM64462]|uniref:lipoprotein n=1 Tax=Streptomyces sp. TRM64462 TaxID=2741726 RepID=UPI0028162D18|nr:lipoprotein [Streptomyces sp. TRM64462]